MSEIAECLCQGNHRYLSVDCWRHAQDGHQSWAYETGIPIKYPPGTFHVEHRCLCLGTSRYYATQCSKAADHGVWAEQDWYGDPPIFEEPHMVNAKVFHDECMASHDRPPGYWRYYGTTG